MKYKSKVDALSNFDPNSQDLNLSAFEKLEGQIATGLLLVCDHATNYLPEFYGTLGLEKCELERHIGYDIGVAEVTRHLSQLLDVPAVLSNYSRLLIDPNRGVHDPTLIMKISDGTLISGNIGITPEERQFRINTFYRPYHKAIDDAIDAGLAIGHTPALLSIHSFTDNWKGTLRPWHITVLWDSDPRLVRPLLHQLGQEQDIIFGENVPYSGELAGDCMNQHGTGRGLAHALIEIRQDLIRTEQGQLDWAMRLARMLKQIFANESLRNSFQTIHAFNEARLFSVI